MRRIGGFARAIESVEGTLQSVDVWRGLRPHMAKVYWGDVVGDHIAAISQVERVENGPDRCVLIVRTKNAVWANELNLLKGRLMDGLNDRLGGRVITDLRFKGSGLEKKAESAGKRENAPAKPPQSVLDGISLHESERYRIETAVSEIQDEALREIVYRSLVAAAQVALWRRKDGWIPCASCGALIPKPEDGRPEICTVCRVSAA